MILFTHNHNSNVNKAFGVLELFVWDEKTLGSDAFIGRVLIPLADIAGSQEPTQAWYKLQKRNEKDVNVKGEVLLQMHYKYMAVSIVSIGTKSH
jgi:hypothetical protein